MWQRPLWSCCLWGFAVLILPIGAVAQPVIVSGSSPFGAANACGEFSGSPPGTLYLDSEVEPWVEVNPTNLDNIVGSFQQDRWSNGGARGLVAGVSTDGGATWTEVPIPGVSDCTGGPFQRATDPWVTFAPNGHVYQMSLALDIDTPPNRPGGFGPNAMLMSKSTDGGLTWGGPITLIFDDDPQVLNDKNSVTADPTDSNLVYAVWDRLRITTADAINPENISPRNPPAFGVRFGFGFEGPAYFARTTDGGQTWEQARKIYDPGANNQTIGNQIVVLPDGTLVDFFTEILNFRNNDHNGRGFNFNLALLRSSDKGVTWQPKNKPIRAQRIFSSGAVTPDSGDDVRDASILFDVAVDSSNGHLFAVWQDTRFNGLEEVAFSMSIDGGFTWSAPIRVNKTPAPAVGHSRREEAIVPSIAVNGNGTLGVTYYDFRNDVDTAGQELADYFIVFCSQDCTDPASWGGETKATDASFNFLDAPNAGGFFLGDYAGLAAEQQPGPNSEFLAFFAQPHDSDPASIFFSRVGVPGF